MKRPLKIYVFKITDSPVKFWADQSKEVFFHLGHKVKVRDLHLGEILNIKSFLSDISTFSPDMVFCIDCFGIGGELCEKLSIPLVAWFVNDPVIRLKEIDSLHSNFFIFSSHKVSLQELKKRGFKNLFYLPFGAAPVFCKEISLGEEDKKRFSCNVSFAGNSGWHVVRQYESFLQDPKYSVAKSALDETLKILVQERLRQNFLVTPLEILNDLKKRRGISFSFGMPDWEIDGFLIHVSYAFHRKAVLSSISDLGLRVYGDWRNLLPEELFFGCLDRTNELPKLYRLSKVNLNITSVRRGRTTNRPFDVCGSGGFLLTDNTPEIGDFFEIDREICVYRDIEDLREKIRWYIKHPEERNEISRRGRESIEGAYLGGEI